MTKPYLFKRKGTGIYYIRWEQRGKGTRMKSTGQRDKIIATRMLNHFTRDLMGGKIIPIKTGRSYTFGEYAEEFKANKEPLIESSTFKLYRVAIDKAISCWGKGILLADIKRPMVKRLLADMAKSGLATPTINKNYRHLRHVLNEAYKDEYIEKPIRWPAFIEEEEYARFLTKPQLQALLYLIDDPEFYDLVNFVAYTGLCAGEIARLSFIDIDNPAGFLRISSEQKNKKESRVPITAAARAVLNRCIERRGEKCFRWMTAGGISHRFKKYMRAAGLPDGIRLHDLRHTYGSHLAMSGRTQKEIQQLMRHKSSASTEKYTQLAPEHLREAAESLSYGPMPVPSKKTKK